VSRFLPDERAQSLESADRLGWTCKHFRFPIPMALPVAAKSGPTRAASPKRATGAPLRRLRVQGPRLLPLVRRSPHGRHRCASGRSRAARGPRAAVGALAALRAASSRRCFGRRCRASGYFCQVAWRVGKNGPNSQTTWQRKTPPERGVVSGFAAATRQMAPLIVSRVARSSPSGPGRSPA